MFSIPRIRMSGTTIPIVVSWTVLTPIPSGWRYARISTARNASGIATAAKTSMILRVSMSVPAAAFPAVGVSVEHQHGARDLAGLHRAKCLVDIAQTAAPADHRIEIQPSLAVEFQVVRDVGAKLVG